MKNQIVASIASIPFLIAGTLTQTQAAQAAALTGSFHFDGADDPSTTVEFSQEMLDFKPDDNPLVDLKVPTGSFAEFETALIEDIYLNSQESQLFMDFGNDNSLFLTGLSEYDLEYDNFAGTTGVTLEFQGFFESETGDKSNARGRITFQTSGKVTESDLENGEVFEASFSGVSVSAERVPEPTALFGLGVAAIGLIGVRRQGKKIS
ncbi:MAG: PEP-CTERM sorting domain-containing protein [Okeania sp. SIO1H6]|nr:PEP-CTERM sorting domain-containing protein [Okeania sp. SIO1H6]